jgi:dienelactone hydrolase
MQVFKNIVLEGPHGRPILLDIFFTDTRVAKPVVIYAHGFNGFKDWGNFDLIAEQFARAGFVFVKFNFSHNGTTPEHPEEFIDLEAYGNNNFIIELNDLQTVIDWVLSDHEKSAHIDRKRLYLIGHSMGGGVVILKAAEEKKVRGVVTWASVAEPKTPWGNWTPDKMKQWKEAGVAYYTNSRTKQELPLFYQLYESYNAKKARLNILKAVKRLKVPLLICHGTADPAVPVGQAHALHEALSSSQLFLVDSDHVFGRKHPWTRPALPKAMDAVVRKSIDFLLSI